ncbi:MAG: DNA internalization-related competence protein ComEC/Rec2 [Sedimentisphaerales bacterium]|jgi:competence protein ComEC
MDIENQQKAENSNQIRRRLAEIDRQFDRCPAYYYKQTISTAPLVFCAIGLIAGIIIQDHLPIPIQVWSSLMITCAVILIALPALFIIWPVIRTKNFVTLPFLTVVLFICLGAIRMASFNSAPPNNIRNLIGNEPNLATVRGVIVTEPYIDSNDWKFSKFTPADRSSSFYLELTEAEATTGWIKTGGLVRVRVNEPIFDLRAGDRVQIYCILNKFNGPANPGEFDMAKYMARNGVFVAGSADSRQAIELLSSDAAGLYPKAKSWLSRIAVNSLLGGPYPRDQSESSLLALVLGYRTNIDKETYNAFRKTGLLHFVCLSGMNFAMVIGFVWWVCKTAGLMKPGRAIVCTIAALLFLMVVPENAPAFRAAVICFAFCASFIFRRRSNPFNSLALAAVVLLLMKPTGIFQPDWQLSFVSVLGILLFSKPIQNFLNETTSGWFVELEKRGLFRRGIFEIVSLITSAFAVSVAAWFANVGILLYHFYGIQYLTTVWTVLVSPLIGLISLLGYLKLIIALFLPSVSAVMGIIINRLSDLLIWIVKLFAGLNISEMLTGKTNVAVILLFYALTIFAFFFPLRRHALKNIICVTAAVILVVSLALPWWQRTHGDNLTVTILDVGHGQAILAQMPGGSNILLDAGSQNRSDVGTKVVTPFLRYSGIGKIDAVVIGHGDIDHINGMPEITWDTRTKVVYASKAFFEDNRQTTKFLRNNLQKITEINNLPQKFGSSKIRVLWPISDIQENNSISDNDKSVVTLIEYAGKRVLICSDIEKFAQNEIFRLYPDLKADVLILPHHGSAKTTEPSFVDKTGAVVTIASCSESSYEKGQVIGPRSGLKSYYTGKNGAVTVCINKQGIISTAAFAKEKQPAY